MRLTILAAALGCAACPVFAETTLNAGAALEYYLEPEGAGSDNVTDVSAYGELDFGGGYVGLSALKSSDDLADELALGFGYRGEAAGLSYDMGYTHYFYPNDTASEYGELVLGVEKGFGDKVTATFDLGYDVTNKAANAFVGAEIAMTEKLAMSANFGLNEVPGASNETEWDLGATYALSDEVGLDLRHFDGSDYADSYIGLALTWDTSKLLN
jgi:hypothetical protein